MILGQQLSLALAERKQALGSSATLHLANEKEPDEDQDYPRRRGSQIAEHIRTLVLGLYFDVLRLESIDQIVVVVLKRDSGHELGESVGRVVRSKAARLLQRPLNFALLERYLKDVLIVHFGDELRVGDLGHLPVKTRQIGIGDKDNQKQRQPEYERLSRSFPTHLVF